jgi:cation diffusion facilitator CzcD-associated flavoprotein CzcO
VLSRSEILIVGAGPAGLAVGACLARRGLRARILERGEEAGWSWARHYESLRLHTPRGLSGLPGLRLSTGRYPDRTEFLAYLGAYARWAGLEIECGREATALTRENGGWRVQTSRGPMQARHVVLASGCYAEPRQPDWNGREQFRGRWLRPAEVWMEPEWDGRRVLVIGLGNTAADVLALLHRRGARTAVSVRGPVHIAPLEILGANSFRWKRWIPERMLSLRRLGERAGRIAERTGERFWWRLQERLFGDLRQRGLSLKSPEEIGRDQRSGRTPVIAGPWVDLLRSGEIQVFPGISEFTAEGAVFVDGRHEPFSDVLLAMGFSERRFPLAGDLTGPLRDGPVPGRPGLWLCGALPALHHIRRAARRVSRGIAGEMRR